MKTQKFLTLITVEKRDFLMSMKSQKGLQKPCLSTYLSQNIFPKSPLQINEHFLNLFRLGVLWQSRLLV